MPTKTFSHEERDYLRKRAQLELLNEAEDIASIKNLANEAIQRIAARIAQRLSISIEDVLKAIEDLIRKLSST